MRRAVIREPKAAIATDADVGMCNLVSIRHMDILRDSC
jgi:hypothetical protein